METEKRSGRLTVKEAWQMAARNNLAKGVSPGLCVLCCVIAVGGLALAFLFPEGLGALIFIVIGGLAGMIVAILDVIKKTENAIIALVIVVVGCFLGLLFIPEYPLWTAPFFAMCGYAAYAGGGFAFEFLWRCLFRTKPE